MEEGGEETATDKEGMEVDTAEVTEEGSGEAWEEDMEEEERCEVVREEDAVERPTRHSHLRLKIILLLKNENHLSKGGVFVVATKISNFCSAIIKCLKTPPLKLFLFARLP